jgi:hypothetical protein
LENYESKESPEEDSDSREWQQVTELAEKGGALKVFDTGSNLS